MIRHARPFAALALAAATLASLADGWADGRAALVPGPGFGALRVVTSLQIQLSPAVAPATTADSFGITSDQTKPKGPVCMYRIHPFDRSPWLAGAFNARK